MIDEAHDQSYTQTVTSSYYNAVDLALCLPDTNIILATATPNNHLLQHAASGSVKMELEHLRGHAAMRCKTFECDGLHPKVLVKLRACILRDKIGLIFLNHRAYSNRIMKHDGNFLRCHVCKRYLFNHKQADK